MCLHDKCRKISLYTMLINRQIKSVISILCESVGTFVTYCSRKPREVFVIQKDYSKRVTAKEREESRVSGTKSTKVCKLEH